MTGRIKRIIKLKSYGFILGEDGEEYFFHAQDLRNLDMDYIDHELGHRREVHIEFEPRASPKGQRAADITMVIQE